MSLRILNSIAQIPREAWQALEPQHFPFAHYAFLSALEQTGCLGDRTGWHPLILTLWQDSTLQGAMLCFEKTNSYGEYIFDFAWAQAFDRLGLAYYPKLVAAIPFTPATGPKILLHPHLTAAEREKTQTTLLQAVLDLAGQSKMSSVHALFHSSEESAVFRANGFFIRQTSQYHFQNPGYRDFADFLQQLRSKRRKEIRREREQVARSGLTIQRLTGAALTAAHAEVMHDFYLNTVRGRGGFDYLTRDFFIEVFMRMQNQILFVLASDASGTPVAGALNYFGDDRLFGRHWGCRIEARALHFELCYYQGMEFVIERKMRLFEAGAQGEHKFQRGFLPNVTLSAHHIFDPRFATLIQNAVEQEKRQIEQMLAAAEQESPFRQRSGD